MLRRSLKLAGSASLFRKVRSTSPSWSTISGSTIRSGHKPRAYQRVRNDCTLHRNFNQLIFGDLIGAPKAGFPEAGTYLSDNSLSKSILGTKYISFNDVLKDQLAQFVELEKELGE